MIKLLNAKYIILTNAIVIKIHATKINTNVFILLVLLLLQRYN